MEEDARRMSSQNIFKAQLPFKQPNHFWTQILCSLSDAGESFPLQRQQRWQKTFVDAAAAVAVAAAAWLEACFLCSPVCLPRRCTCSASHFPPWLPPVVCQFKLQNSSEACEMCCSLGAATLWWICSTKWERSEPSRWPGHKQSRSARPETFHTLRFVPQAYLVFL